MAKERNLRRKGPSSSSSSSGSDLDSSSSSSSEAENSSLAGGYGRKDGKMNGSSQIGLTPGTMVLLNLELALVYLMSQSPGFATSPLIELSGSCVPVSTSSKLGCSIDGSDMPNIPVPGRCVQPP